MNRRSFLKVLGGTAAATALAETIGISAESPEKEGEREVKPLPKRLLGKTGEKISIIGYGGLALNYEEQDVVNNSISMAIDRGLNYFDVAPAYGSAEEKMGIALEGKRDKVFISCKTGRRDKRGAESELERSLKRLKTDHFDVYQMHHLRRPDEVEEAFGPDGAMEAFVAARKKGQVRFLGFSAHTMKAALLAMDKFSFDTIMFPINFMEFIQTKFGPPIVEKAKEKGMGILAMKGMYAGLWPAGAKRPAPKWWYRPVSDPEAIDLALRFTLSQPCVATAITPSDVKLIRLATEIGPNYRPLSEGDLSKLEALSEGFVSYFANEEKKVALRSYWDCGSILA